MTGSTLARPLGYPRARPGVALVLAVLVLALLAALASGLLFVGLQDTRIALATEEALRVRLAAESAVRATIARWPYSDAASLRVGDRRSLESGVEASGGIRAVVTLERLVGAHLLVAAEARSEGGGLARAAGRVRVLDVPDLWSVFPAALTAGTPSRPPASVRIEGAEGLAVDPDGRACPFAASEALLATFGPGPRPAILPEVGRPSWAEPSRLDAEPPTFRLGPIDADLIRAFADRIESGTVAPAPRAAGESCEVAVGGNWGDPRGASPCAEYLPLIFAAGDLRVDGGVGQGILVVDGDLTLDGGAEFHGPVLLTGRLRLSGDAVIHGAVTRAGEGAANVVGEGRILYAVCSLWRAFAGSSLLERPLRPRTRAWLPARRSARKRVRDARQRLPGRGRPESANSLNRRVLVAGTDFVSRGGLNVHRERSAPTTGSLDAERARARRVVFRGTVPLIACECAMKVARPGITLIELIIVLVIGGVLTGVAFSQMGRNAARQEARNARDAFVVLASRARAAAIETGSVVRLEVDLGDGTARVLPGRSGSSDPIERKSFSAEHGVQLTAAGAAGSTVIVCYSPRGYAVSCENSIDDDVTLTFRRVDHSFDALIRPLGQVERR